MVYATSVKAAMSKMVTREFVHAEQASLSRNLHFYDGWSRVVVDTFDATCTDGDMMDPGSKDEDVYGNPKA